MRHLVYSFLLMILVSGCAEKNKTFPASDVTLIPRPASLALGEGSFAFVDGLSVAVQSSDQTSTANYFIDAIGGKTATRPELRQGANAAIVFEQVEGMEAEGYRLDVTPQKVAIKAGDASGYFYAVQSIFQLLERQDNGTWLLPSVTIKDHPRFQWRAYMLDESRYFHGEEFVKRMLDQMALLKMNVFHWHLVDDAGWRLEIKKYPRLTEVGAFRADSEIEIWGSGKTSGEPHGGFYTQAQIRDIVAYAAERHITIVPEIEMPGHSSAAIAAYPWLGTAGKAIDVPVKFGRHYDNYDVTKPEVIRFIQDVLTETFALFPSQVIHIGGDEVGYKSWEDAEHVRKYMKDNGINTPADLQIRFTNDISRFIEKNGRRMMGWNEIMGVNIHQGFPEKKHDKDAETELAENVIVHFWKGDIELATDAAQKGYGIVNSLHSGTYLDYDYESISLEKAYAFNPIPEGLEPQYHKHIYGLGCQMWSEWTPTNADVERQTFPRIAAYAEVGWSAPANKDFDRFKRALEKLQNHWGALNINYARVMKD